ncbi:transporter substrate-binding domain-containing protein [Colwellia piezophila]|uniref:transporter substrate-binding domain-containing protein n=1 Tax=Colwellia piezophila TaxID=211668 RepID=UPI0003611A97|nr:transporter substrate-binding domain-containing protein [Colwellia piezophila]
MAINLYFIGPIRNEVIVFVTYVNSNYHLNSLDDIIKLDKPIAIQRDAYYGKVIERFIHHNDYKGYFVHVPDNETKLRLLKRGRISGFLEVKRNVIHGIKHDVQYYGLRYSGLIIHQNPIYFALSKQSINEALQQNIAQGFARLVEKGTLKEIVAKYQKHDFQ